MHDLAIVIPAVKKNVAFPDDLVKKLAGVSLIQRAIDTAKRAFHAQQIHVVTDSEEVRLICQRNEVACIYDKALRLESDNLLGSLCAHLDALLDEKRALFLLSPYAPLLKAAELQDAYREFLDRDAELMIPVYSTRLRIFNDAPRPLSRLMHDGAGSELTSESHAFLILKTALFRQADDHPAKPVAYPLAGMSAEIHNYQDWWLCEKLIRRRRIVFRVIGN